MNIKFRTTFYLVALLAFCAILITGCGGGGGGGSDDPAVTTGTVKGNITDDTGNPLSGVLVTVESKEATTDADGNYSISGIPAGDRVISAVLEGYQQAEVSITVKAGTTVTKDFVLSPIPPESGTVSGDVVDDATGNPIPGAQVTIDLASGVSGNDGAYSISGVSVGERTVLSVKDGYVNYSDTVDVVNGQTTTKEIRMTPAAGTTGSVTGLVTDSVSGDPVQGAVIQAGEISGQTDISGRYTINGIPAGTVNVSAAKDNYFTVTESVNVEAGQTATRNISMVLASGTYYDSFDDNNGGYVASGTNSTWQFGKPTAGPTGARSLARCWGTNLSGDYNNNEKSVLTSPNIDLSSKSGQGDLIITWYQWSVIEKGSDYLTVQVSKDGGTSWSAIDHKTGTEENSWTKHTAYVDESYAVSNFKIRFCFYSDNTVTYNGVYIDDIQIESTETGSNPVDVYALIIGINDYPGTVNDLRWCVPDAIKIKNSLATAPGWFGKSKIVVLTDSLAQESKITEVLADFKNSADSNDLVVVTYSGHGSNDGVTGSHAYLCVWNGTADGLISDVELQNMLDEMPCKTAVFLDCCHSGGMIITRGDKKPENQVRVMTSVPGYDPDFKGNMFSRKSRALDSLENIVAVSACTYEELSSENSTLENGVFTYYLVQGFGNGATFGPADVNHDDRISAEEVYNYLNPLATAFKSTQHAQMVDHYPSIASPGDDLTVKY